MTRFQPGSGRILLVEDNAGDALLAREALRDAKMTNALDWVQDGAEAIDFLRRRGPHAEAKRPDLILLDLNMPRMDGWEVLAEIKNDPDLRRIPVVVLTTSQSETDVRRCYDLHANCYISKPIGFHEFVQTVKAIEHFWFDLALLPESP